MNSLGRLSGAGQPAGDGNNMHAESSSSSSSFHQHAATTGGGISTIDSLRAHLILAQQQQQQQQIDPIAAQLMSLQQQQQQRQQPTTASSQHNLLQRDTTRSVYSRQQHDRVPVRVPCCARDMPLEHNFQTAYFVIDPTMAHGTELLCSYPSCRASGSKFRYCFYCNKAVHKRNFWKEHSHNQDRRNSTDSSSSSAANIETNSQRVSNFGAVDSMHAQGLDGHHAEGRVRNVEGMMISAEDNHSHAIRNVLLPEGAAPGGKEVLRHIIESENKHGIDRELLSSWVALFMERPMTEDPDSMTIWLKRVLTVSENVQGKLLQQEGDDDSIGSNE